MHQPPVKTTGTWVEVKRNRPHGKLTQDCIRNIRHYGLNSEGLPRKVNTVDGRITSTTENMRPGRKSLASSRSTANTASKKLSRFVKVNGQHDYRMDRPTTVSPGAKSLTSVYASGPAAIDTTGTGLASRIGNKARG